MVINPPWTMPDALDAMGEGAPRRVRCAKRRGLCPGVESSRRADGPKGSNPAISVSSPGSSTASAAASRCEPAAAALVPLRPRVLLLSAPARGEDLDGAQTKRAPQPLPGRRRRRSARRRRPPHEAGPPSKASCAARLVRRPALHRPALWDHPAPGLARGDEAHAHDAVRPADHWVGQARRTAWISSSGSSRHAPWDAYS